MYNHCGVKFKNCKDSSEFIHLSVSIPVINASVMSGDFT